MNETLYGLTKDEIRHRRDLLMETIRNYSIKHYDARIMLPEYKKLTQWLNANGCKLVDQEYCTDKYWSNPLKYDRQNMNKNPIIEVKEGRAIRKFMTNELKKDNKRYSVPKESEPKTEIKRQSLQVPHNKSYYKIIISWTETQDANTPVMDKVLQFFNELGLDQIDRDSGTAGSGVEHQIAYKFEGTDDGFIMLKRSAMVLLDILNENNNFEIAIYGKKISK